MNASQCYENIKFERNPMWVTFRSSGFTRFHSNFSWYCYLFVIRDVARKLVVVMLLSMDSESA